MKKHHHCLLCQSKELKPLPDYQRAFLQQCQVCGFVFCAPIPTQEELLEHYAGYPRIDNISAITIKRYHALLDELEPYRRLNRILDVGSGNGHFLQVALERNWQVFGTEFADDAVAFCESKGISMQQGELNPANYEPDSFDVITSFEVLEHINNPVEEIQRFRQLLRPGGLVYLTTPNFNSLLRYYLKQDWSIIEYPEHLSYYTAKTLKFLFESNGFTLPQAVATTGLSIGRIQEAKTKKQQAVAPPIAPPAAVSPSAEAAEANGEPEVRQFRSGDEKLRQQIENNPLVNLAYKSVNGLLSAFSVGDTLKGFFVKAK